MEIIPLLSKELGVAEWQIKNAVSLIDEGCTIPFIARYRKERTSSLDDGVLRSLNERLSYLRGLETRRAEVKSLIDEQGKLSPNVAKAIDSAVTLSEIDDIYRPFRPKRRTRASIAREKGLQPLADFVLRQQGGKPELEAEVKRAAAGLEPDDDAIHGALDIIAETVSDDAQLRGLLRTLFETRSLIQSRAAKKDTQDSVYSKYYEFNESVAKIPPHRVLAIDRGERDGFLKVSIELEDSQPLNVIFRKYIKNGSYTAELVKAACEDAYARLIFPSAERELRTQLTETAQVQAVRVFAGNLKPLLMQPPLKGKTILGLDPAYRTGCKVAVIDPTGKPLETAVIYPTPPQSKVDEAKATLTRIIKEHGIQVVAIGNGTASRETEIFTAELIKELGGGISYMVVSEAGASVYSASELGAEEFPGYDVSLRSAVSIARRLQDPLAELVKIDPKAIGVGQYQHDVKTSQLDESLKGVVEDCVNTVGVDLNTASFSLLSYVSGISAAVARNIEEYRAENGAFKNRRELLKVRKLGPKAFEQCAGFLRISNGENVLDSTSVHPESYGAAQKLLSLFDYSLPDIAAGKLTGIRERAGAMGQRETAAAVGVGVPTMVDILNELLAPGRDPRDELPPPLLRTGIMGIGDLKPGMQLTGTVRNVTDFGAFIDIGVHQDGLVHISEMAAHYVKSPYDEVQVGDIVNVTVLAVDTAKGRISLTMKPQQ